MQDDFDQSKIEDFLEKTPLVIWGCGSNGKLIFSLRRELIELVSGVVDSDPGKKGKIFMDKWEIQSPDILDCKKHKVIVTPLDNGEIIEVLKKKGFTHLENFFLLNEYIRIVLSKKLQATLNDYSETHPNVKIITFNSIIFPKDHLTEHEKYIKDNWLKYGQILENPKLSPVLMDRFKSEENVQEVLTPPKSYYNAYGVRRFEDTAGKLVNTLNGNRVTTGQPERHKRTIFVLPDCTVFGIGACDQGTIASQLQDMLNRFAPDEGFRVENYGYFLQDRVLFDEENRDVYVASQEEGFSILQSLPAKCGDIVLYRTYHTYQEMIDLSSLSARPHHFGELFWDIRHLTENGYRLTAAHLFKHLQSHDFFKSVTQDTGGPAETKIKSANPAKNLDIAAKEKLEAYKREISKLKPKIGAIVMNCNPFTLGHRYLIEYAASRVSHLIIFVVQENQSMIPFDDRLALVKQGVSDLSNLSVIPSGEFIISSLTFSEYFNKSEYQDRVIDPSLDVQLFAQEIAPCLSINLRFVGEEPFDSITRQYNNTLRAILPMHGVELVEVPRKESGGAAISASRVRELLERRDWKSIEALVPKSTLDYLKARFI